MNASLNSLKTFHVPVFPSNVLLLFYSPEWAVLISSNECFKDSFQAKN
jgi:hypothetical protein